MKHAEVIENHKGLIAVKKLEGFDVNYGISKNLALLKPEISALSKQEKQIQKILEPLNKEKEDYIKNHPSAIKTMLPNGNVQFTLKDKDQDEALKMLAEIEKKHVAIQEEFDKKFKEFELWLEETESTFVPWLIAIDKVPANVTTEQMAGLFPFLKHE